MSYLNKLYELTAALDQSASKEGCEADLMVVGSAQLWNLLQFVRLLKATDEGQVPTAQPEEAERICKDLLDSEKYADEAAVPKVAEEAVVVIKRLATGLKATQMALSLAMQHSEGASKLIEQIAGLSIWGYDNDDGNSYSECDEPSDGFMDSHCCLMGLIEKARSVQSAM